MDTKVGVLVIIGVCVLVLLIGILKKKAEILLNFATRAVVCFIAAYFVNTFFQARGLDVAIGFNLISLLTFGSLGFSGMAALYGILFFQIL
ncbi:MAG: pro-sigmaK processing inhibitor BofA family protein [Clostridiales bacterium]|nr:pro-sigmaK processing inhibitor BofA family protein [Clostridiales bacterium]